MKNKYYDLSESIDTIVKLIIAFAFLCMPFFALYKKHIYKEEEKKKTERLDSIYDAYKNHLYTEENTLVYDESFWITWDNRHYKSFANKLIGKLIVANPTHIIHENEDYEIINVTETTKSIIINVSADDTEFLENVDNVVFHLQKEYYFNITKNYTDTFYLNENHMLFLIKCSDVEFYNENIVIHGACSLADREKYNTLQLNWVFKY